MGYYEDELTGMYAGKRITVNLDDLSLNNTDFGWDPDYSEAEDDEDPIGGNGCMRLSDRPSDEDDNWTVIISVSFTVNAEGLIESVEPRAEVFCFGDSGLGDCDPEDIWTDEDVELASQFLDSITE